MPANKTLRISFWSIPRTVSTACLRSFAGRADCTGVDEPFYAWYLAQTGKQHPLRDEVLAAQAQDWREVVEQVLAVPISTPLQFVKHMSHHMVGDIGLDWLDSAEHRHVFLLRGPSEQLPSIQRELGDISIVDAGWTRHHQLFTVLPNPLVIDSRELLENPERMLRALCLELEIDFDPCMIKWEAGRHPSYGVWAPSWYPAVEKSTGFQPWRPRQEDFPAELEPLLAECMPLYEEMRAVRLKA